MGGAIFVVDGGSLTIRGALNLDGNTVSGGSGRHLVAPARARLRLRLRHLPAGQQRLAHFRCARQRPTQHVANVIADQTGSGGTPANGMQAASASPRTAPAPWCSRATTPTAVPPPSTPAPCKWATAAPAAPSAAASRQQCRPRLQPLGQHHRRQHHQRQGHGHPGRHRHAGTHRHQHLHRRHHHQRRHRRDRRTPIVGHWHRHPQRRPAVGQQHSQPGQQPDHCRGRHRHHRRCRWLHLGPDRRR